VNATIGPGRRRRLEAPHARDSATSRRPPARARRAFEAHVVQMPPPIKVVELLLRTNRSPPICLGITLRTRSVVVAYPRLLLTLSSPWAVCRLNWLWARFFRFWTPSVASPDWKGSYLYCSYWASNRE
jgi:hypothetical protein